MPTPARGSTCWPEGAPRSSPNGFAPIQECKSCAGTVRPRTPRGVRDALPAAVQVVRPVAPVARIGRSRHPGKSPPTPRAGPKRQLRGDGSRARATAERWAQVHGLLEKGVGLLDCGRRLNLGLNTVKRYARASEPERLRRVPQYRPTLVEPYRDHLRRRRAEEPAGAGRAAAGGDSRAWLSRQREPAASVPEPGPSGRGPGASVASPCGRAAADPAGESGRSAERAS